MIEFVEKTPHHLFVRCSSEFDHLEPIVDGTQAFLNKHLENEELAYNIVLLVSEACTNAIEHGNGLDPSKTMVMDVVLDAGKVEVTVEDQGEGFDPSNIENPLEADNILEASGRGLYFIEEIADEFAYENEGRRVRFSLKLNA